MCGIAGIVSDRLGGIREESIQVMQSCLNHRGPDDRGVVVTENVGFAHTRLSIIDIAGGLQPMYSRDRRLLITFNGEIFNYLELRQDLLNSGHQFSTSSDTEVILENFAKYGEASFEKLLGQFAFALHDFTTTTTYLVRDRLGEKPLYFANFNGCLAFASELKAIWNWAQIEDQELSLSCGNVSHFLSLNYVPFGGNFFKEITQLQPGHFLQIGKGTQKLLSYWSPSLTESNSQIAEQFEDLLEDSVRLRMRSDVPVGIFLSGGIDSTTIASALHTCQADVTAFIADFSPSTFSEAETAIRTAHSLAIPYKRILIEPEQQNLPELLEKLVYYADAPLADSSALAVYLLSQATAKHVKVVLSGDGADELFGGYLTYAASKLARKIPSTIRRSLFSVRGIATLLPASNSKVSFREKLDRFLRGLALPPGCAHFAWNGMFAQAEKLQLLHPDILNQIRDEEETFCHLAHRLHVDTNQPSMRQLMLADQHCYLSDDILAKVDRMSMAHGLEVRPVFLDHRMVEFSRALQANPCFQDAIGKKLLTNYLAKNLPTYPSNRPKQGFSIPVHLWFRTKLKDYAESVLFSSETESLHIFNTEVLRKYWQLHQAGNRDLGFHLWGVLVSLLWMRKFKPSRIW